MEDLLASLHIHIHIPLMLVIYAKTSSNEHVHTRTAFVLLVLRSISSYSKGIYQLSLSKDSEGIHQPIMHPLYNHGKGRSYFSAK